MIERREFIVKVMKIVSATSLSLGGLYLFNKNKDSSSCTQSRCTDCSKSSSCQNPLAMSWRKNKDKDQVLQKDSFDR